MPSKANNYQTKISELQNNIESVFNYAPISIILINSELDLILANDQFCKLLGFTIEELQNMNVEDFTHSSDSDNNTLLFEKLFKGLINTFTITKKYTKKDQSVIWVKLTASSINIIEGSPRIAVGIVQNISAEKIATEELIKSEYKYRTLIENANDGIGLFSQTMKPLIYNSTLYDMLNYSLSEYLKIDHNKNELFHPDDKAAAKDAIEKAKNNEKTIIQKRLRYASGEYKYFSISYIPVIHEEKPAILIFRKDISKRVEAEQQNEEYRLFLETIMEELPVSLFAKTTPDFRYLYWNKTMELMTAIPAESAIGSNDFEIFQMRSQAEEYNREDQKILKSKKRLEKEHEIVDITGKTKQIRTIKTLHNPPTGNPIVLGISIDITKLKNIEKQVEQSDQLLKEAQKITKLGYWEYDPQKDIIIDNKENREIFGTTRVNYFLSSSQLLDIVVPADRHVISNTFITCVEKKIAGDGFIRIKVGSKIKHIAINYKPIFNSNNEVLKLRGTSLDITRIRESEMALQESEKRLKQAEHIAKVGYWNYDYQNNITEFSDEVSIILEMPMDNKSTEFNQFFHSVHPDDKVETAAVFHKSKGSHKPFDFDFRIVTPQNCIKYIKAKGTFVKNKEGVTIKSIGTFQDISELKIQQKELEKFTQHLKTIQQLSKTGYIEYEINNDATLNYSDTMLSILDAKETPKSIDSYNELIVAHDKNRVIETINNSFDNQTNYNIQYKIKVNDKIKFINEIGQHNKKLNPKKKLITRVIQNISYIQEKEQALTKSKLHFNQAATTNLIGIWEYNTETKNYIISKEAKKILNITDEHQNISFKEVLNCIHPDDQFSIKKLFSKSFNQKENYNLSYRIIPFNTNKVKYVKDTGRYIQNKEGEWIITGTIKDISDIKETKQQLSKANDLVRIMSDNLTNPIAIIQNNCIIFSNKAWISLFKTIENSLEVEANVINKINSLANSKESGTIQLNAKTKADFQLTQTEYNQKSALYIQLLN